VKEIVKIYGRKPYTGESKLGYLLDAIAPRYEDSGKTCEALNIDKVLHEDVGSYTVVFNKNMVDSVSLGDGVLKCRAWVNFDGTKDKDKM
jgi:hypothetical protein